jgi:hypothetical protein
MRPGFQLLTVLQRSAMFLIMAALMLIFGDQFPFSNFPMYSVLPDSVICMRVTDSAGKLLPLDPAFGIGTTLLKKQMERELHEMKDAGTINKISDPGLPAAKKAGKVVLDWLLAHHPPRRAELSGQTVKLEQVSYRVKHGEVVEKVDVLAEGRAQEVTR